MRIVITHPGAETGARWVAALSARLPEAEVFASRDGDGPPADYGIGWMPPDGFFSEQTRLRAFFSAAAGVDHLLGHPGLPPALPLIRLEDAGMGTQMAHYCLHEVLRLQRRSADFEAQQRATTWRDLEIEPPSAWPVGVVGLGVLGTQVARTIAAEGFSVRGYSQRPRQVEDVACFDASQGLREFLSGCRVAILLLPLTPASTDLFDAERLSWLPRGAWLINVGRGALLVEQALLDALDGDRLSGATLDVFRHEPLPEAHPFWAHPKIRITPHVSAVTRVEESAAQIAEKLRRFEQGLAVGGTVDRGRGY